MKEIINKFFVYGTLRPDIKVPWSDTIHSNPKFNLRYYKAILNHSKLFFHKKIGYPMTIFDPEVYSKDNFTVGYILESDNIEETLKLFDEIEDYPVEYDRFIIKCFNQDNLVEEDVYFYSHKLESLEKDDLIDIKTNDFKFYN